MNHNISYYAWPGIPESDRRPEILTDEYIIKVVCEHYGFDRERLNKRTRRFEVVRARYVCWTMIQRYIRRYSLKRMGGLFGTYDHATVINGLNRLADHYETDENLRQDLEVITRRIR